MGWKKFFVGEPMPDVNDPQYKQRHEDLVQAGEKFAHFSGLSWIGARIRSWAMNHKVAFLVIVFSIVIGLFLWNTYRLIRALSYSGERHPVLTEQVDSLMRSKNMVNH